MDTTTLLNFPAGGVADKPANIAVQTELQKRKFYGDALDGQFGKNSNLALAGFKAAVKGDFVDVLMSQTGAKETPVGSNGGPTVNLYLDACGLKGQREPWCACFITWGLHRWMENNPQAPKFTAPVEAGAWEWEDACRHIPNVRIFHPGATILTLQRGDIVIYTFHHIGTFVMMGGDGLMRNQEGNTDYAGSRTGGQVLLHPRSKSLIRAVIRLPWHI